MPAVDCEQLVSEKSQGLLAAACGRGLVRVRVRVKMSRVVLWNSRMLRRVLHRRRELLQQEGVYVRHLAPYTGKNRNHGPRLASWTGFPGGVLATKGDSIPPRPVVAEGFVSTRQHPR